MAVTDLTDALPWWARQGAGPTGGPGVTPQGSGGVGGQPPPGMNQQAALQYLMAMFSPGSAQAAGNDPTATLNRGGTPPVNNSIDASVVPPAAPTPAGPSFLPQARGVAAPPDPSQSPTPWFTSSNTPMPWEGPPVRTPATSNATPPPRPGPGPLTVGGAGGQGATSNPRFVQLNSGQNIDPTARNRGPQMTALNLAGLFSGAGQPANPANLPAPNAQTVSGPLAAGGMSKAPWGMGPLQKGMVWPKDMGPLTPDQAAGRGLKQRYS